MGPYISEKELNSSLDYIELAKDEGATVRYGGGQSDNEKCKK